MKLTTEIVCRLDLDRPGKCFGVLELTHSDNALAFGIIPVPIVVIASGHGPTVLLAAGTHGDEYEGQAILRRLAAEIEPNQVSGRLIICPPSTFRPFSTMRGSPLSMVATSIAAFRAASMPDEQRPSQTSSHAGSCHWSMPASISTRVEASRALLRQRSCAPMPIRRFSGKASRWRRPSVRPSPW